MTRIENGWHTIDLLISCSLEIQKTLQEFLEKYFQEDDYRVVSLDGKQSQFLLGDVLKLQFKNEADLHLFKLTFDDTIITDISSMIATTAWVMHNPVWHVVCDATNNPPSEVAKNHLNVDIYATSCEFPSHCIISNITVAK